MVGPTIRICLGIVESVQVQNELEGDKNYNYLWVHLTPKCFHI